VILASSLGATGCMPSTTVQLPVSGRVYFEDVHEETEAFSPLPNALVIVRRNNSCPRNIWLLAEGAVNTIDSHVVRTDSDGYFSVPPKKVEITRSCNAVMSASVAVPFMRSAGAFVLAHPLAENPERYSGLSRQDVVVRPKEHYWHKYQDGQIELRRLLRGLAGNAGGAEVYREMLPEICQVLKEDPEDRYPNYTFRDELLVYLDEEDLECLPGARA
jgi:hypothetical protein